MDKRKIPCVWLNVQHFQKCFFNVEEREMTITVYVPAEERRGLEIAILQEMVPPVSLEAKGNFMLQHDSREHQN